MNKKTLFVVVVIIVIGIVVVFNRFNRDLPKPKFSQKLKKIQFFKAST